MIWVYNYYVKSEGFCNVNFINVVETPGRGWVFLANSYEDGMWGCEINQQGVPEVY